MFKILSSIAMPETGYNYNFNHNPQFSGCFQLPWSRVQNLPEFGSIVISNKFWLAFLEAGNSNCCLCTLFVYVQQMSLF